MPIEIKCPKCKRAFRVPDKYGGKRVKCPKCQATIAVPGVSESAAKKPGPRTAARQEKTPRKQAAAVKPSPQIWYLQTEDGEQYGPVAKEELDGWIAEGRIDASCQLLQEGWQQWKWAEDVYPQLAQLAETPAKPAHEPAPAATDENPFAGIVQTAPSERKGGAFVSPRESDEGPAADDSAEGGAVTAGARRALKQTKPWVTFLAILGFISGGLGALGGLVVFAVLALGLGLRGAMIGMAAFVGPAVSLVMAYYLFAYGQRIYVYLRSEKPRDLESALVAQKSFWKLAGIVTATLLALYLILGLTIYALSMQAASSLRNMVDTPPPGL